MTRVYTVFLVTLQVLFTSLPPDLKMMPKRAMKHKRKAKRKVNKALNEPQRAAKKKHAFSSQHGLLRILY